MASKAPKPRRPATRKQDPLAVVELFFARMRSLDMEGAMDLVADDCVYQNVPFHKATGKARIQRDLSLMGKAVTEFQVEMKNAAASGGTVLTERVDIFIGKGFRTELPVMGTFVVRNGKITEWRDYFDWSLSVGRVAGAAFSALRSRLTRSKK
jgi:limonene-1,2-epoxide hydrolase